MLNATVELVTAPDTVEVGKPFAATFRLSNHGETLPQGVAKLGSWEPKDNRFWGDTRAQLPFSFGPGQNENFEVATFVAQQTGQFPFAWAAVWEGRAWFGKPSATKVITVVPASGGGGPPPVTPPPPPSGGTGLTGKEIITEWPTRTRADQFDLRGAMIINTDAFVAGTPANRQTRVLRWVNKSTTSPLCIDAVKIWLGVSGGGKCDAHGDLVREGDRALVAALQADHYVDGPSGAAVEHQHWNGRYMALEPGEALLFSYFAVGFTPNCQAHFTVSLWGHYG